MTGHQHRCPQCGSTIFVYVPSLHLETIAATTAISGQPPQLLTLSFSAQVCLACGRTDLYTADAESLCRLASAPDTGVVVLDVTATAGDL